MLTPHKSIHSSPRLHLQGLTDTRTIKYEKERERATDNIEEQQWKHARVFRFVQSFWKFFFHLSQTDKTNALHQNKTFNCTAANCRATNRLTKGLTEMRHRPKKKKKRVNDTNEKFKDGWKNERLKQYKYHSDCITYHGTYKIFIYCGIFVNKAFQRAMWYYYGTW